MIPWQENIEKAYQRLQSTVYAPYRTSLEWSAFFSDLTGANIFFKQEHMQRTGSFKYRGALYKLLNLTSAETDKGVITASTGNHGMACALAAKQLGIPLTIYLPEDVSEVKRHSIKLLGAQIEVVLGDCLDAELQAKAVAEQRNRVFISPYNDQDVIAGQGTIGFEVAEQLPEIDAIFVAVGGGGLVSGVGSYLKAIKPEVEIIGCWPENSASLYHSLAAGEMVECEEKYTLSDGTAGAPEKGTITFSLCQKVIDRKILVSELQIKQAIKAFAQYERQIIEGAAGVALAAALDSAIDYQRKNIAVVICGRNIPLNKFIDVTNYK